MIPLRDSIPSRRRPVVMVTIIAVCVVVFLVQAAYETRLAEELGMIPARLLEPGAQVVVPEAYRGRQLVAVHAAAPSLVPAWLTVLTCIFLHGGWLHLLMNMWFLWIFGDNVEDRLGHVGFAAFYLGCGVAGSLGHLLSAGVEPVVLENGSQAVLGIPTVGASGAIAGVMGAYFVLYPRSQVLTLVPIFFFLHFVMLPAPVFLGIWFLLQLFQGTLEVTAAAGGGGVAWWAHIGGFVAGLAVGAWVRASSRKPPPAPRVVRERYRPYDPRPPGGPWF